MKHNSKESKLDYEFHEMVESEEYEKSEHKMGMPESMEKHKIKCGGKFK
jgi:hypothetical protein